MAKKMRVKYNENLTLFVDPETWDLCEKVYYSSLRSRDVAKTDPVEAQIQWYEKNHNGGVSRDKAEKIVRKNSLFYYAETEVTLAVVKKELKTVGVGKKSINKDYRRDDGLSTDFIEKVCLVFINQRIKDDPKGFWAKTKKFLKKKYVDDNKVQQRLLETSPQKAVIRMVLKTMDENGYKLPKTAYKKG